MVRVSRAQTATPQRFFLPARDGSGVRSDTGTVSWYDARSVHWSFAIRGSPGPAGLEILTTVDNAVPRVLRLYTILPVFRGVPAAGATAGGGIASCELGDRPRFRVASGATIVTGMTRAVAAPARCVPTTTPSLLGDAACTNPFRKRTHSAPPCALEMLLLPASVGPTISTNMGCVVILPSIASICGHEWRYSRHACDPPPCRTACILPALGAVSRCTLASGNLGSTGRIPRRDRWSTGRSQRPSLRC